MRTTQRLVKRGVRLQEEYASATISQLRKVKSGNTTNGLRSSRPTGSRLRTDRCQSIPVQEKSTSISYPPLKPLLPPSATPINSANHSLPHHLTATKIDIPKILRSSISDLPRTRSNHHHPPTLPTENKPHRRSTTEHATRTHVQGPTFHAYSYLMQRTAQLVADSDPVDPCACAEQRFDTLPTLPTLRTNGRTVDQCICTPHPLSMYLSAYMDACMHEVIDNLLIDKVGSTQSRIWPTSTFHHTWRA